MMGVGSSLDALHLHNPVNHPHPTQRVDMATLDTNPTVRQIRELLSHHASLTGEDIGAKTRIPRNNLQPVLREMQRARMITVHKNPGSQKLYYRAVVC